MARIAYPVVPCHCMPFRGRYTSYHAYCSSIARTPLPWGGGGEGPAMHRVDYSCFILQTWRAGSIRDHRHDQYHLPPSFIKEYAESGQGAIAAELGRMLFCMVGILEVLLAPARGWSLRLIYSVLRAPVGSEESHHLLVPLVAAERPLLPGSANEQCRLLFSTTLQKDVRTVSFLSLALGEHGTELPGQSGIPMETSQGEFPPAFRDKYRADRATSRQQCLFG